MSDHSEIDPALVQAFLGAIPEAATLTQFENAPIFDPKGKEIWYELFNLTNPAEAVTLGEGGQDEISGVFQVNIYVPLNTSTKATNTAIESLNSFFVIGKSLSYGSTIVKITRCGKSGASGESQGYYKTIVSVYWTARMNRGAIEEIANPFNAMVQINSCMEPPQAYVDNIFKIFPAYISNGVIDFVGVTAIRNTQNFYYTLAMQADVNSFTFANSSLSGSSITDFFIWAFDHFTSNPYWIFANGDFTGPNNGDVNFFDSSFLSSFVSMLSSTFGQQASYNLFRANYHGVPVVLGGVNFEFPNNNLTVQQVEDLLYIAVGTGSENGTFNTAGQTPPAAPAKQDAAIGGGGELYLRDGTFNGKPKYTYPDSGDSIRWNGAQWSNTNGSVATSGNAAFPWLATGPAWFVNQAPNANVLLLQSRTWSVNTD